ncbi:polysaccharide pyruvyl transferase family protein [Desertivirga xinjiangensis]|uniref:polysaccharide pyruvyl transferase family protein n=1 Tax=Desertivirga xinjiangensis TaxID=539206 RepID=UPI00210872B6|nr:polysaccharide pyruvyl transferase family protein [Pedobacter xinjiangensis]
MQNRRQFLKQAACLTSIPFLGSVVNALAASPGSARPTILLRSSWQTVNIGDIGHTFGIMELFQRHIPDADVILWPVSINNGVDELLKKSFPSLKIVIGNLDAQGNPGNTELKKAFEDCQLMVHGSGPWVAASADLNAWSKLTKKPFGIYGVSLETASAGLKDLLNKASFFYARDTISLKFIKSLNLKIPVLEFAPDATFAIKLHNEEKADRYLKSTGLKAGEFICAIPRLRYTPYFQIRNIPPTEEEKKKYENSLKYKEADAAKLREVIIRWVRETNLKVLACPEMTYQVAMAKEVLVDPLPEDVKKNVVWRDRYWNPDEAGSVYAKARALVSYEMHSPIIAFTEGVPSIHLKQPTDTTKGQMWRDIGLSDWLFEIEDTSAKQIGDALMKIHNNYSWALSEMKKSDGKVKSLQKKSMQLVRKISNS